MKTIVSIVIALLLLATINLFSQTRSLPAFPGAEGFGARSAGGRGGRVIAVTNLKDKGPGSLRAACEAKGPRIVVFRISGIIELKSTLEINEPYLTIAGQTAPGDGICLKNYNLVLRGTHDVVIRYLRVRPGDQMGKEQDAISVYTSQNVIIDHCSTGWGTDETLSVTGAGTDNVTVQWCLISESLNNSVHHKGKHGYGSLIRIDGNISYHHNLYADHYSRNPRPGCYGNFQRGSLLDFRNNVVYNWGLKPGYSSQDKTTVNYVGNYLKPGPSTHKNVKHYAFMVGGSSTSLFVDGNIMEGVPGADQDNWKLVALKDSSQIYDVRLPMPESYAYVTTESAKDAYRDVLARAGAVLPRRDAVDTRVVQDVEKNTGKIIDSQKEVGGWPEYNSAAAPKDSDGDGMPDDWENKYDLTISDPSDGNEDADKDGYTNIEEYLNGTNPLVPDKNQLTLIPTTY